jgi:hypothetical protein
MHASAWGARRRDTAPPREPRQEHRRRRAANLKRRAQCFVAESKRWITSLGLSELHLHPDSYKLFSLSLFCQIFVFKDIG